MSLMRFVLDDGTEVEVEAEPGVQGAPYGSVPRGPVERGAVERGPAPVERAQRSFEEALGVVKRTVGAAVREMRDAFPERPDELEVEFGIKASLEANGLILAKAAGEASFVVKAVWKKPSAGE
ncbi:MAG TPA: CU044_2847 family protein [Longimicrobium sp.]|nr:CU044_2847 family protein [Longimicrobium sp.]